MRLNYLLSGLYALLILFALAGCNAGAPQTERLRPLDDQARIVAYGDSLTWGNGAKRDEAYPAVLGNLLGLEVLNVSSLTDESAKAASKFATILDSMQPDLVLLCVGSYDFLHEVAPDTTRKQIARMIRDAQARKIDLVLLAVPNPRSEHRDAAPLFAELGREFNIPVDTTIIPTLLAEKVTRSDPIHPNAEGYRRLAEGVRDLLRREGAMR